ncbi:MAG: hypothetical protein ABJ357_07005, partial [Parasphingorhabdus sp.]
MTITIEELLERWGTDEGKPYKGQLIDWDAYTDNPSNTGCMCAQGQVLHEIGGMEPRSIHELAQQDADTKVMKLLNIPRGQAILLRNINDSQNGAPAIVITEPEKVLGDNAREVLAFFKYLDSLSYADWQKVRSASVAASVAASGAAWTAASVAAWTAAGIAAGDAARDAASGAAGIAAGDAA